MQNPTDIVITRHMAEKYFGKSDAMNKTLTLKINDGFEDFVVKGITENVPSNSSIQFDLLISDSNYPKFYTDRAQSAWFNIIPETYVLLKYGSDVNNVVTKFPKLFEKELGEDLYKESKYQVGLQLIFIWIPVSPQELQKLITRLIPIYWLLLLV